MSSQRHEMLQRVERLVCGDRDEQYGPPEDSFGSIAVLASEVLGRPFTPLDVALFMACLKLARLKRDPEHLDSWIDLGGYAVCGGSIVLGRRGDV